MSRVIATGEQNFEEIRRNNCFYVDKTDFIREWWDSRKPVTLITRPRRFGKTLTLDMLEKFFSIEYARRSDLFEGLKIWEYPEFRELQGTFPVIFASFADTEGKNFEEVRLRLNDVITSLYGKYRFLKGQGFLEGNDLVYYDRVTFDMDEITAISSLKHLCMVLENYYGRKPIILLDEYDVPMQDAYVNGFWDELSDFMRKLFRATFKSNTSLGRGLLTGITRISKENIFSGLNNLKVLTVTSNQYASAFGFTEEEVEESLQEYGLGDQFARVKDWYDGFRFGDTCHIYNPWSITNFLEEKKFKAYWVNSSSNKLVEKLIREGSKEIKTSFEDLLLGRMISTEIIEDIVFDQLDDNQEAVWSLLLAGGYLRVEGAGFGPREYSLGVTNHEVQEMFQSIVRSWFTNKSKTAFNQFIRALLSGDVNALNENLHEIIQRTVSYFDVGGKSNPECFYHGFVLGLIVDLENQYTIDSNRESGNGRYDVMLSPKQKELDAVILEFKVANSDTEEALRSAVQNALTQIKEKNYDEKLVSREISKEKIIHYGFAFSGKQVLVGKESMEGIEIPELELSENFNRMNFHRTDGKDKDFIENCRRNLTN